MGVLDSLVSDIIKGYKSSKAVALAGNVVNKDTAKQILGKAQRIANALGKKVI